MQETVWKFSGNVKIKVTSLSSTHTAKTNEDFQNVYSELNSEFMVFYGKTPFQQAPKSTFISLNFLSKKLIKEECSFKLVLLVKNLKVEWKEGQKSMVIGDISHNISIILKTSNDQLQCLYDSFPLSSRLFQSSQKLLQQPPASSVDSLTRKTELLQKFKFKKDKISRYQEKSPVAVMFSIKEAFSIIESCCQVIETIGMNTEGLYRISGPSNSIKEILQLFYEYPCMKINNLVTVSNLSVAKTGLTRSSTINAGTSRSRNYSKNPIEGSSEWSVNRKSIDDLGAAKLIKHVNNSKMKDNRVKFDCMYESDVHLLTGLIKLILRDHLKSSLFDTKYDEIITATKLYPDKLDLRVHLQRIILQLPKENVRFLEFITKHIFYVSTHSDINFMHIKNLAVVFGPTLIRAPISSESDVIAAVKGMQFQIKAVECLLENSSFIFDNQIVSESSDTVYVKESGTLPVESKATKRFSDSQLQLAPEIALNLKRQESKSLQDFEANFAQLRTKDNIIQIKRNRRRHQIMTKNQLFDETAASVESINGLDPSTETVHMIENDS